MEPFDKRKEEFLKRYEELVKELKVDVGTGPHWMAIGGGAFTTVISKEVIDLANQPVVSPFQQT